MVGQSATFQVPGSTFTFQVPWFQVPSFRVRWFWVPCSGYRVRSQETSRESVARPAMIAGTDAFDQGAARRRSTDSPSTRGRDARSAGHASGMVIVPSASRIPRDGPRDAQAVHASPPDAPGGNQAGVERRLHSRHRPWRRVQQSRSVHAGIPATLRRHASQLSGTRARGRVGRGAHAPRCARSHIGAVLRAVSRPHVRTPESIDAHVVD